MELNIYIKQIKDPKSKFCPHHHVDYKIEHIHKRNKIPRIIHVIHINTNWQIQNTTYIIANM